MQYDKRLTGETALAFEYFELYRDMPHRTLRKLTLIPVRGKTRDLKTIGRWSSNFRWKERVQAFDDEKNRRAAQAIVTRQQAEIEAFIEADLEIARGIQEMTQQHLAHIKETQTRDAAEMRKLALMYNVSRIWLMELIGIIKEKDNGTPETSQPR
ncbi:MAG: hypothetical protein OXT74_16420 [Candidatus Poribacteria bacterium]|nr:hypothetical protein [Candidatus Poribacteria bacterium]